MKKIDDNPLAISKAMFQNRADWKYVTDKQKEDMFFLFNRNFSKEYPEFSQLLNSKSIDKVSAMDNWFLFMKDKEYPSFFWKKEEKEKKSTKEISESDFELLLVKLNLNKKEDLYYLIDNHKEEVLEELKYYKNKK